MVLLTLVYQLVHKDQRVQTDRTAHREQTAKMVLQAEMGRTVRTAYLPASALSASLAAMSLRLQTPSTPAGRRSM